jgi:hypothetical protein
MGFIILIVLAAIATTVGLIFLPNRRTFVGLASATFVAFAFLVCSITIASTGHIKVKTWFGEIQPGFVPDTGLQLVNPLLSLTDVDITRREIDPTDGEHAGEVKTGTADDNFLTVGAIMPYSVNPTFAGKLLSRIPTFDTVMMPNSANSALRKGISEHQWTEVVKDTTGATALSIETDWKARVNEQLIAAGFTADEAKVVFTFFPVQIKKALPDEKVLQATANRSAEAENLKMQETLTKQAAEVAKRRVNEGSGLANVIKAALGLQETDKMPNISPAQMADLLRAIAAQERATALVKIADSNRPLTIIINGDGGGSPVSIPAGAPTEAPTK